MTYWTTAAWPQVGQAMRATARQFITGVTVVAVYGDRGPHAMTANSFVTLSLDPPLVAVAIRPSGRFRGLLDEARYFGISILSSSQDAYARFYADPARSAPAAGTLLVSSPEPMPVPVVPGCLGYFVCSIDEIQPVGDHDLLIGEVEDCWESDVPQQPLAFFGGALKA